MSYKRDPFSFLFFESKQDGLNPCSLSKGGCALPSLFNYEFIRNQHFFFLFLNVNKNPVLSKQLGSISIHL